MIYPVELSRAGLSQTSHNHANDRQVIAQPMKPKHDQLVKGGSNLDGA
jgi:hypothetical protein